MVGSRWTEPWQKAFAERTKSCESDVSEAFSLPPSLSLASLTETKSPALDTFSKLESRLLPRPKQTGVRPFRGIVTTACSSQLNEQRRLSALSWNAGPKGRITGAFRVIMVEEAETPRDCDSG